MGKVSRAKGSASRWLLLLLPLPAFVADVAIVTAVSVTGSL